MDVKKIAIIHTDGNINVNENLISFCNLLYKNGYIVDIWSKIDRNNIQLPPQGHYNLFLTYEFYEIDVIYSNYSFVIGVDHGIIIADQLANTLNIPYGLLSYEIFFDDELRLKSDKYFKEKAKKACQGISMAIVQDKIRSSFLSKEYSIDESKIYIMPVAGEGIVSHKTSNFLHHHLKLSSNTKILLHFGSSFKWNLLEWSIANADSLPKDWILVIHDKHGNYGQTSINHKRVYRSNLPALKRDQMHLLIQSANCCLGLYQKTDESIYTGKNIEFIGLSSGKLNLSLQHGVPVAINQLGLLSELVENYRAGIIIDINKLNPFRRLESLDNINNISMNCHKLFKENIDISNYITPITSKINHLCTNNNLDFSYNPNYAKPEYKIAYYFNLLTLKNQLNLLCRLAANFLKKVLYK